jgi:hypothetical protein
MQIQDGGDGTFDDVFLLAEFVSDISMFQMWRIPYVALPSVQW